MSTEAASSVAKPEADTTVPTHLGIILDGNRRWAKDRGLPVFEGHRHGYETLKKIGEAAHRRGIKYFTAFVFSTENWERSQEEVGYLMRLFYWVATHEVKELNNRNIRLRIIGSRHRLDPKLIKAIDAAEAATKDNDGGTLALCLNYGGQQEIVDAAKAMMSAGVKANDVTTDSLAAHLYAPDIPPLDLMIRTSGEQRVSGFMLWRLAYAEMKFVDIHWPDFSEADLDACLTDYASRQRRFGK